MTALKRAWISAYFAWPVVYMADQWMFFYLAWGLPVSALGMIVFYLIERDYAQESSPDASSIRRASLQKRLDRLESGPLQTLSLAPPR